MKGIHKNRILIIEDDEEMRALLKEFLIEEGYEADGAGSGSEALKILARKFYDLIITDIRMPGLTGLDILPGIKKLQPRGSIIAITAFGSEEVYQRSMEKGATAYLEKPICFNTLGPLIRRLLLITDDDKINVQSIFSREGGESN
jgi:DNA-binding NtrC family response regulator